MYFLGIESSCDETAAAVFTDELQILASVIASQIDLHSRFGGVVPEVAARAHLQRLLPVIDEALHEAGVRLELFVAVKRRDRVVNEDLNLRDLWVHCRRRTVHRQ